MYLLMLDVACGSKSYREREMASQAAASLIGSFPLMKA
jgi:hypothetical protein